MKEKRFRKHLGKSLLVLSFDIDKAFDMTTLEWHNNQNIMI